MQLLTLHLFNRYLTLRLFFIFYTLKYQSIKQHWNGVDPTGSVPAEKIKEWIDHSYTIVVDSLPKSKREILQ